MTITASIGNAASCFADSLYTTFDKFSYRVTNQILMTPKNQIQTDPSAESYETKKHEFVALLVKVSTIVLTVMSVWIILCHPILTLTALTLGTIVHLEPETQASITLWTHSFCPLVIDPILKNESPLEKLALAALAVSTSILIASTVAAPMIIGLTLGFYIRGSLSLIQV